MIEAITIEGLRGIREGSLEGLGALTILTGPNGCGKSTVLDALFIATHPRPDVGVALAVSRRKASWNAAQWLVANFAASARLACRTDRGDAIIEAGEADVMEKATLFNLALDGGALKVSRYSGAQMQLARSDIESDLR